MCLTELELPLSQELSPQDIESIKTFAKDLSAVGIHIELPSPLAGGRLTIKYDPNAHKRNAGRKRKRMPTDSVLQDMTQEQMDNWLLNNTIDETCKELGISRSTAFRRRAEARERISYAIVHLDNSTTTHS